MKGNRITTVIAIVAVAIAVTTVAYRVLGPSEDQHVAAGEHNGEREGRAKQDEEAVVQLTAAEMKEFGIEVGTAEGGTLHIYTVLPGEIVANQDHVAHVVPRFPGIVTDVRKH